MISLAFRATLCDRCTIRREVLDAVTNGEFDTDTYWAKGAEWTIGSGVATFVSTGAGSALSQDVGAVSGERYRIGFDMTVEAGAPVITPSIGGVAGRALLSAGEKLLEIFATSSGDFILTGTGSVDASATIDNIEIFRITGGGTKVGTQTDIATEVHCRFEERTGREMFRDSQAVISNGVLFLGPEDVKENDAILITAQGGQSVTEYLLNAITIRPQYTGQRLHHLEIDVERVK